MTTLRFIRAVGVCAVPLAVFVWLGWSSSVSGEEQLPPAEAEESSAKEADAVPRVDPLPDPEPWDPEAVYGSWELINEAIVASWTELDNPFDDESDWSDVPGAEEDIGVLMSINIPLSEEEGGELVRYVIVVAAGDIDGEPKCWLYDDGGAGGRGKHVWCPVCCLSQAWICRTVNQILGLLGDALCPSSYCGDCVQECKDGCDDPSKGKPCHSCDPCGGSWILCHIVWDGHC